MVDQNDIADQNTIADMKDVADQEEAAVQAPLLSALIDIAKKDNLRMHMPGHKGRRLDFFRSVDMFEIDFTEIPETGNLYEGIPPILDAELLMAQAVSAKDSFFLTGGATQGIMTALATVCPPGSKVVIDRASHRSVWSAMVHLDLRPVYLYREQLPGWEISAAIQAEEVGKVLKEYPDAAAVVLTSPSYYGVLSDIPMIAEVTKSYQVPLIVDEAHGAHLPFLKGYSGAVAQGASLSVASAHKTLPALTAGAYLFSAGDFAPREIRRKAMLFGTSSPSYPVMASLDAARAYMQGKGRQKYHAIADEVAELRMFVNSHTPYRALIPQAFVQLDPTRFTVNTAVGGICGHDAATYLASEQHIVCEMADVKHIVMIITGEDSIEELVRIREALMAMALHSKKDSMGNANTTGNAPFCQDTKFGSVPKPVQRATPREAAYSPREYIRLKNAIGRTAGEHLAPYPPGVPVVAAGEELTEVHLRYLKQIGYDMESEISVIA